MFIKSSINIIVLSMESLKMHMVRFNINVSNNNCLIINEDMRKSMKRDLDKITMKATGKKISPD